MVAQGLYLSRHLKDDAADGRRPARRATGQRVSVSAVDLERALRGALQPSSARGEDDSAPARRAMPARAKARHFTVRITSARFNGL